MKNPEKLTQHHKIPKCLLRIFPKCKGLREAIKSPSNIEMLNVRDHREKHIETPEMLDCLRRAFKGKKYRETIIFRA